MITHLAGDEKNKRKFLKSSPYAMLETNRIEAKTCTHTHSMNYINRLVASMLFLLITAL